MRIAAKPSPSMRPRGSTAVRCSCVAAVALFTHASVLQGAYSCAIALAEGTPTDAFVTYCMRNVFLMRSAGVKPLLVFDGASLPSKVFHFDNTNFKVFQTDQFSFMDSVLRWSRAAKGARLVWLRPVGLHWRGKWPTRTGLTRAA